MIVHSAREAPPTGFKTQGPAPSDKTFDLRIALVSNNMSGLEKALYDVSTPGSANYRKFLTKKQACHTFHHCFKLISYCVRLIGRVLR
jgi:tripeptidyl-peptidase I